MWIFIDYSWDSGSSEASVEGATEKKAIYRCLSQRWKAVWEETVVVVLAACLPAFWSGGVHGRGSVSLVRGPLAVFLKSVVLQGKSEGYSHTVRVTDYHALLC